MKRQLGAAVLAASTLALTGCINTPDVIGAAVAPQIETTTVTVTKTQSITPPQCEQAIALAYEIIDAYGDLTQLNIDIMQDLVDKDWDNAETRMDRALSEMDPINRKKIEFVNAEAGCR